MKKQILSLNERVELALMLGESHFREFKSAIEGSPKNKKPRNVKEICIDIARTLVAFANADGGELLVGVEDNFNVTGLDHTEQQIEQILKSTNVYVHKDTPLPNLTALEIFLKSKRKKIAYFSVSKGSDFIYLTSDGRCIQRRDRESIPMSAEKIKFDRNEVISREYDRQFVNNASIANLKIDLIESVAYTISSGLSVEKCLQHLNLAEFDGQNFRLRKAALLLFAHDSNKWHPRLQVRILKIDGKEIKSGKDYNIIKDEEVSGNILELIHESWELVRTHLTETKFTDARFRTQIIYPELACREALTNAIAHRDYSNEGRGIEVHIYSDKLEIVNPGGLLSSIKIEDIRELKGVHESRNSLISRVLREMGYMRELGEGMKRIFELMSSNDLTDPELYTDKNIFRITLHHRYIYSEEERLWLENFNNLTLLRDQKTVVRLGYNNHIISPKEIWDAVGIVDTDYYRQLIESLRDKGILYKSVTEQAIWKKARNEGVPRKGVPRYSIRIPDEKTIIDTKTPIDLAEYIRLFIGNIPYSITRYELENIFKRFGDVVDVYIPKDGDGRIKGFAFIEFADSSSGLKAIKESWKLKIDGRRIHINLAKPK